MVQNSDTKVEIPKFGMFKGVFVPTLLTILGVIMFLRLGWVVGNVGLIGAWIIIVIAFLITTATALSMSSIISNMAIGSGGAYSIITRSMGLEIGGSIGVPLYLALSFSMAIYIFGFREGLLFLFPTAPALLIDFAIFAMLLGIVALSTDLAFRIQYLILAVILVSLISIYLAGIGVTPSFALLQPPEGLSFWMVFAVFFPAATGIMAGANMSGELQDPRRSIFVGTLAAILVSFAIYLSLAYISAGIAPRDELLGSYTILIERAAVPMLVVAGLLAATFSSALNSLVGASRILQSMGEHNILPWSPWFSQRARSGVPRNAILFTALIVAGTLMLRDLNIVAPLITMFFLITYGMLNVVILIEQSLSLVSFRPMLRIPRAVPLIGTFGCLFTMFVINPVFSLVALFVVGGFYYILMTRHLKTTTLYGDVRSSLFVAIAEWAAKRSKSLPASQERAWRPHLMVPVDNAAELRGVSELIRDIAYPRGSVSILGVQIDVVKEELDRELTSITRDFQDDGIYATWTTVRGENLAEVAVAGIQTLKSSFFAPNIVFLRMPGTPEREGEVQTIVRSATENRIGGLLFAAHPKAALGRRRSINLWIAEECLAWIPGERLPNCDLAMLIAYKLRVNWDARLTLIAAVSDPDRVSIVRQNLQDLVELARLPVEEILVVNMEEAEYLHQAPHASLNIFSLSWPLDFSAIRRALEDTRSTCMFCRDSTEESVLV